MQFESCACARHLQRSGRVAEGCLCGGEDRVQAGVEPSRTDEDWQQGYPQEFQDFVESIAQQREPLSGVELARDTVAVLYSAYLSAERRGTEVEIPFLEET